MCMCWVFLKSLTFIYKSSIFIDYVPNAKSASSDVNSILGDNEVKRIHADVDQGMSDRLIVTSTTSGAEEKFDEQQRAPPEAAPAQPEAAPAQPATESSATTDDFEKSTEPITIFSAPEATTTEPVTTFQEFTTTMKEPLTSTEIESFMSTEEQVETEESLGTTYESIISIKNFTVINEVSESERFGTYTVEELMTSTNSESNTEQKSSIEPVTTTTEPSTTTTEPTTTTTETKTTTTEPTTTTTEPTTTTTEPSTVITEPTTTTTKSTTSTTEPTTISAAETETITAVATYNVELTTTPLSIQSTEPATTFSSTKITQSMAATIEQTNFTTDFLLPIDLSTTPLDNNLSQLVGFLKNNATKVELSQTLFSCLIMFYFFRYTLRF